MSEAKAQGEAAKPAEKKKAKAPAADLLNEKKSTKVAWTLEKCKKAARRFTNENEWQAGAPASYKSALAHGWVAQCMGKAAGHKKSA